MFSAQSSLAWVDNLVLHLVEYILLRSCPRMLLNHFSLYFFKFLALTAHSLAFLYHSLALPLIKLPFQFPDTKTALWYMGSNQFANHFRKLRVKYLTKILLNFPTKQLTKHSAKLLASHLTKLMLKFRMILLRILFTKVSTKF